MEQSSNAIGIDILKLVITMRELDREVVSRFLKAESPAPIGYPDVANLIGELINIGKWDDMNALVRDKRVLIGIGGVYR